MEKHQTIKEVKNYDMINCKTLERYLMVDDNLNELIFTPEIE